MPKNGRGAEPGLGGGGAGRGGVVVGGPPAAGVIMSPPVSVCPQVSTTVQRPSPTTSWYQRQISGLIGSPTEPRMRSDLREGRVPNSAPACAIARRAVGAV